MVTWHAGGCLCGAVRYELAAEGAFDAGYCHCSMCRRSTGAPVLAWALVRRSHFRLVQSPFENALERRDAALRACFRAVPQPRKPGFMRVPAAVSMG